VTTRHVHENWRGGDHPPVEPEGELVEVVGQVLTADPVVQGAGCPTFEQRRDQVTCRIKPRIAPPKAIMIRTKNGCIAASNFTDALYKRR
jgi:hypothetical protein